MAPVRRERPPSCHARGVTSGGGGARKPTGAGRLLAVVASPLTARDVWRGSDTRRLCTEDEASAPPRTGEVTGGGGSARDLWDRLAIAQPDWAASGATPAGARRRLAVARREGSLGRAPRHLSGGPGLAPAADRTFDGRRSTQGVKVVAIVAHISGSPLPAGSTCLHARGDTARAPRSCRVVSRLARRARSRSSGTGPGGRRPRSVPRRAPDPHR